MQGAIYEDEIDAVLLAMREQEGKSYKCTRDCYGVHGPLNGMLSCSSSDEVTNQTRQLLCGWCYKVVDFCELDREVVEIAMSIVDRCVQTEKGEKIMHHAHSFQLLVVTSLYTAIKCHCEFAISVAQFEKISRNCFTEKDLERMERSLLEMLSWHVNPCTSLCFVRLFLELIPTKEMGIDRKDTAYILSKIQTELAVSDGSFVSVKASTIAFASIMNSFEALGMMEMNSGSALLQSFVSKVALLGFVETELPCNDAFMCSVQSRLYRAIAKQENISILTGRGSRIPRRGVARNKSFEESPRSIISRTA